MQWEHNITIHNPEEFAIPKGENANDRVFSCEGDGVCTLNDGGVLEKDRLKQLLDGYGNSGWELVSLEFLDQVMVCFWKRPK